MDKVQIKKVKFSLTGNVIAKGEKLLFSAYDLDNQKVNINDIKGMKVISFFPDINTSICDQQTKLIFEWSKKHPDVNFISISTDDVDTLKNWCLANNVENIFALSDHQMLDFGKKTNTLIKKINKLARGFIVLNDENIIVDIIMDSEVATDPDFKSLEKLLNQL